MPRSCGADSAFGRDCSRVSPHGVWKACQKRHANAEPAWCCSERRPSPRSAQPDGAFPARRRDGTAVALELCMVGSDGGSAARTPVLVDGASARGAESPRSRRVLAARSARAGARHRCRATHRRDGVGSRAMPRERRVWMPRRLLQNRSGDSAFGRDTSHRVLAIAGQLWLTCSVNAESGWW